RHSRPIRPPRSSHPRRFPGVGLSLHLSYAQPPWLPHQLWHCDNILHQLINRGGPWLSRPVITRRAIADPCPRNGLANHLHTYRFRINAFTIVRQVTLESFYAFTRIPNTCPIFKMKKQPIL